MNTKTAIKVDDLEDLELGVVRRRMPQTFTTRRRLQVTVEEFGERYRISVGALRTREAGTATPDAVAEACLLAIARDPDTVAAAVAAGQRVTVE